MAFLSLLVLVTIFESLRSILKYNASFVDALFYISAQIPWLITQTAPMASLLAALVYWALTIVFSYFQERLEQRMARSDR